MAKWILIFSLVAAGIILVYFGKDLVTGEPHHQTAVPPSANVITITDSFKDGLHRYTGEIQLPHSCYSIAVDARRDALNPHKVLLTLMTRDGMTDMSLCFKIPTRYPFETVVEAPLDTTPTLFIDDKETPTRVVETPWQNPKGTILNLENI